MRRSSGPVGLTALAGFVVLSAAAAAQTAAGTGDARLEVLAHGLDHPWGMAFLPDGRLLVTERAGTLRILSPGGDLSGPVAGTPQVAAGGQGGLLDVAVDPDFAENGFVYLSFSARREGGSATAVGRGRLVDDSIADFEPLFLQEPFIDDNKHFGGRVLFSPDGHLFLTMGDRFQFDPAQDLSNHLGTIVRIARDGSVPDDNPFAGREGARPEIWSYGHRNIQGAAFHPQTGALWIVEMGPSGGDELNKVEPGRNYGWPLVSWGRHYGGGNIPDPPTRPEFTDAVTQWTPVIAPSGMVFYTGAMFPEWQGSALIGGLRAAAIVRLTFDGETVTQEERIPLASRIRDVEQAPDGSVYVLTDERNGKIIRLSRGGG